MSTFSIHQLRQKYKKIIESQDSDSDNINKNKVTFAIKKSLNQTRILTQHRQNMTQSKPKNHASNSVFVALKERIAQGIQNLTEKDREIENYKITILKQKSEISSLETQIKQLKITLEETNNKVVEEKINAAGLEKQMQRFKVTIKDQKINKELVFKQIQFYKKQIKDLKNEKKQLNILLQKTQKQIQKVDKLKNDNIRLKQNIDRMQVIINQCCQQSIKINLSDKYYLGKPLKESYCWFSQNLVGQVESFLSKWQIGINNKQFIDSLVKFIDQYKKLSKPSSSCNKSKKTKSIHKNSESKRYSTSLQCNYEMLSTNKSRIQNSLKKSILINKYKKRNKRMYTQSLYDQEKNVKQSNVYEQIIDQYQKALKLALEQSEIKPKKIMLLSKQLKESFSNYMEETK